MWTLVFALVTIDPCSIAGPAELRCSDSVSKENPYESPQLDDCELPLDSNGPGRLAIVFAAVSLTLLTAMAFSQNLAFVCVASVLLLIGALARTSAANWNKRWPRISDDEFVAKCATGTDRDTALRVRRIVSEQLGIDYDRIHPDQVFVSDLGCE